MQQKIRVLKFGGSSVKDVACLNRCAALVKKEVEAGYKVCVVVSAMGSQTNQLLSLAFSINKEASRRELDMLLSTGERVSCALLAIALANLGVEALSLTGSQCGILTDAVHQNAKLSDIKCDRIYASFLSNQVVVVAGFQGVNPVTKEITTLGRGGSDLTAVALAVKLKAEDCLIYTDVDGLMTVDPRICETARLVPRTSWLLAYNLSCRGAEVLHYRCSFLALKNKIPLKILNSQNPNGEGTIVQEHTMEKQVTQFISFKKNQSYVCVSSIYGDLNKLFEKTISWFWERDETPCFTRLEKGKAGKSSLYIMVRSDLINGFCLFLEKEQREFLFEKIYEEVFVLSLLGGGYQHNIGFLQELRHVIESAPLLYDISESFVTIALKTERFEELINRVHRHFLK